MKILTPQQLQRIREDFQTLYKSSQNNDPELFAAAADHFAATLNEAQTKHPINQPKPDL